MGKVIKWVNPKEPGNSMDTTKTLGDAIDELYDFITAVAKNVAEGESYGAYKFANQLVKDFDSAKWHYENFLGNFDIVPLDECGDKDIIVKEDYDESDPLPKYIDVGPYKLRYAFDSEGNYDAYDVTDRKGEYIGEIDAGDIRKILPLYDTDSREAEMSIIDLIESLDDDGEVAIDFEPGFEDDEFDDFETGFEDDEFDECKINEEGLPCKSSDSEWRKVLADNNISAIPNGKGIIVRSTFDFMKFEGFHDGERMVNAMQDILDHGGWDKVGDEWISPDKTLSCECVGNEDFKITFKKIESNDEEIVKEDDSEPVLDDPADDQNLDELDFDQFKDLMRLVDKNPDYKVYYNSATKVHRIYSTKKEAGRRILKGVNAILADEGDIAEGKVVGTAFDDYVEFLWPECIKAPVKEDMEKSSC